MVANLSGWSKEKIDDLQRTLNSETRRLITSDSFAIDIRQLNRHVVAILMYCETC